MSNNYKAGMKVLILLGLLVVFVSLAIGVVIGMKMDASPDGRVALADTQPLVEQFATTTATQPADTTVQPTSSTTVVARADPVTTTTAVTAEIPEPPTTTTTTTLVKILSPEPQLLALDKEPVVDVTYDLLLRSPTEPVVTATAKVTVSVSASIDVADVVVTEEPPTSTRGWWVYLLKTTVQPVLSVKVNPPSACQYSDTKSPVVCEGFVDLEGKLTPEGTSVLRRLALSTCLNDGTPNVLRQIEVEYEREVSAMNQIPRGELVAWVNLEIPERPSVLELGPEFSNVGWIAEVAGYTCTGFSQ